MVELLISMLLLATAVSAILAGMLSAPQNLNRAQRKVQGTQYAEALLQELKNFVIDETLISDGTVSAADWHLPDDTNPDWALADGDHDATAMLPSAFRSAPFNASMTYAVSTVLQNGLPTKSVSVQLSWSEP